MPDLTSHCAPEHEEFITVHVAYALPERQIILPVRVTRDATLIDAIRQSGLLEQHPELSRVPLKVGIFGHIVALDLPLEEGMRIEIYRPLLTDPKTSRRQRAALARKRQSRP